MVAAVSVKKGVLTLTFPPVASPPVIGEVQEANFVMGLNSELHVLLGRYKDQINRHFRNKRWDRGKRAANDYELVYTPHSGVPGLACVSPASRSYFKLWELLHDFEHDVFPDGGVATPGRPRRCVFIAEGPGGFLEAYATMRGGALGLDTLHGMTLSPRIGQSRNAVSVPYWRLPQWVSQRARALRLCNGATGDGNVCWPADVDALVADTGGEGQCDFITADGGFDFTGDFNGQEQASVLLIACEIMAALRLQAQGGAFVLKVYDIHEKATLQLLHVLALCYSHVHIAKPFTSRPANSEKYLVCTGFRGAPGGPAAAVRQAAVGTLRALALHVATGRGTLGFDIPGLLPPPLNMLYALLQYNVHSVMQQMVSITRTLVAIESNYTVDDRAVVHRQLEHALRWCHKYGITVAPKALQVHKERLGLRPAHPKKTDSGLKPTG